MAFSFDPALSTDKDYIRLLIGDTDSASPQFDDTTITGLASRYAGPVRVAQALCASLASKYSRLADQQIGQLKVSMSQLAEGYAARAVELGKQADSTAVLVPMPYAGGLKISDKIAREDDADRVRPLFTRDMDEFKTPGNDPTTSGGL